MWSITYLSAEVSPLTRSQLYDLLAASRKKNAQLGITGLLLHKNGNFIQTIEGGENEVRELFVTIRAIGT